MQYKDYYKIIGVARDASADEIKRAYRKLARKYHPDVSREPNAEARFKEINEAAEVLRDPEKRAAYDQLGGQWKSGEDFQPPPNWNTGPQYSAGDNPFGTADFSDFFGALYGRHTRSKGPSAGFSVQNQDLHSRVLIDIEDAFGGTTRSVTLRAPDIDSEGRGSARERTLNVKIPKGIRAGQHIRLAGQGAPGVGGGRPGDLYLEIEFRPHPLYRVEDSDVLADLPLAPWEAALGATIKVPTPGGAVELKVPPNSPAGRKLRLKGYGLPGSVPGDFFAVIQIVLPPANAESAQEAYRNFSKEFGSFNPRAKFGV